MAFKVRPFRSFLAPDVYEVPYADYSLDVHGCQVAAFAASSGYWPIAFLRFIRPCTCPVGHHGVDPGGGEYDCRLSDQRKRMLPIPVSAMPAIFSWPLVAGGRGLGNAIFYYLAAYSAATLTALCAGSDRAAVRFLQRRQLQWAL